uniref:F-box domain-containing protein n=1 Tax=Dunaliella tertiolecta TaxID=3047 RepID=A0A7S3QWW7_DUNTE|mmetsp:Transcript_9251/g.24901  ORF Transcript_9251/g.24901 Transcript_9251/m.24901 type:complete len:253 (+) Transcript_9251:130-888(+)
MPCVRKSLRSVVEQRSRRRKAAGIQPPSDCQPHANLLDAIPQELIVKVLEKVDAEALNAFFCTCHEARAFKDVTELQVPWLRQHVPGTALLRACRAQRPLIAVRMLQDADIAGINAADRTKSTPLHHACISGMVDVVAGLVQREGLNVNALDALRRTPLTIACKAGHKPVAELLCGVPGVDLNQADCEGENPLLAACSEGHAGIVELLLRQVPAPDIMVRTCDYAGPLYLAASRGHSDVRVSKAIYKLWSCF